MCTNVSKSPYNVKYCALFIHLFIFLLRMCTRHSYCFPTYESNE